MLKNLWMSPLEDKNHDRFFGKNLLAIDLGVKNTGMAIYCAGDDLFPNPQKTLAVKDRHRLMEEIIQIIKRENIHTLIVGVPYTLDGRETVMATKHKKFGKTLKSKLPGLVVCYQDEALSSWEAQERMKKSPLYNFKIDKTKLHALAACIILEDFLISSRRTGESHPLKENHAI